MKIGLAPAENRSVGLTGTISWVRWNPSSSSNPSASTMWRNMPSGGASKLYGLALSVRFWKSGIGTLRVRGRSSAQTRELERRTMGQTSAHPDLILSWYTPLARPVKEGIKAFGGEETGMMEEWIPPEEVAAEFCFLLDFPSFYGGTEWNSTSWHRLRIPTRYRNRSGSTSRSITGRRISTLCSINCVVISNAASIRASPRPTIDWPMHWRPIISNRWSNVTRKLLRRLLRPAIHPPGP
ncbi:MAG: hypothetical protein LZF62_10004 [Nitrospira sp.]|nr:MAG: hypothetical protein LZF62_10004 [Nitrospira sp.]